MQRLGARGRLQEVAAYQSGTTRAKFLSQACSAGILKLGRVKACEVFVLL